MVSASSLTATAAFVACLATSALATGACTRQYTVQPGDICNSISAANNVSTYQLAVVNEGIIDAQCSNLEIGKTICLGRGKDDCTSTYVVQPDDTCDLVANNHRFNTTILYLNNPQINSGCTNIYPGEVLCVSAAVQVPLAPAGTPQADLPGAVPPQGVQPNHQDTHASSQPNPPPADDNNNDDDDENLPFCDEL